MGIRPQSGARSRRTAALLSSGLLLASVLASFVLIGNFLSELAEAAGPTGPNPPLGIHLSYLDDPTTAVVTWHTASPAPSRPGWGTSSGGSYPCSASGVDYASPMGTFLHAVTLSNLIPSSRYYYRVGDASMNSSYGEASFRAAPPKGSTETFSFAAAGDWGNSQGTADTSNAIKAVDPNLVLPLGDLYYSPNETIVKQIFQKWQAFGQSSFVEPALGNHEHPSTQMWHTAEDIHCAFVNLPGNERTYAFTFGDTLFLSIDWGLWSNNTSDGVDGTGSACGGVSGTAAIRSWVDARLAAANLDPNITWKVVFQHFQCYDMTTVNYFPMCPSAGHPLDQMEDILTNRGVDLVLQAHEHTYSRSHPVKFHNVVQNGSAYDTPRAPVYFVLGTGGDPRTATCRNDSWVAVCRAPTKTTAFGHFTVSPTTIQYEFLENSAGVLDSFTLTKRPASTYALSVDPTSVEMRRNATATALVDVLGFSHDLVNLSISGCPANTECTLSPGNGTPSFSSTLRLATSPTSPQAPADLVIAATNASVSKTVAFHLTVTDRVTRTFRKGDGGAFSETDDTYLYNGTPDANFGTDPKLYVDNADCIAKATICKVLIKFPQIIGPDPAQIPANSTIASATLDLTVLNAGVKQDLYQVTEAWNESTATLTSGSSQVIEFACEDLPDEATCTFTPTTCGPPCSADLILGTSLNTSEGSYDVVIRASDGNISRTANFTLNISTPPAPPPDFDFTMSIDPTSASVAPGESVNATVTETILSGSTDDVQYSCADLPEGASCAFSPPECDPTCSAILTLTTSAGTPDGTTVVTVTAADSDGEVAHSVDFSLVVSGPHVLTFRKGDGGAFSETDDAFIYNGTPNGNYGTNSKLFVDAADCIKVATICRSLLKFPDFIGPNAGQVPPGSAIVSAILELTITDRGGTQYLYQVTEAWTESAVTWNAFATPGSPGAKGNALTFAAPLGLIRLNLTAIVQNWVNGDPNHGVLIRSPSADGVDYYASESAAPPTLTVTFRSPRSNAEPRGESDSAPRGTFSSPQTLPIPGAAGSIEIWTREATWDEAF